MKTHRQESLLEDILETTEEACKAARIEHDTALQSALGKREQLIARLIGFDPEMPLPHFSQAQAALKLGIKGSVNRTMLRRIHEVQHHLDRSLETRRRRLDAERAHLRTGERFFNGMKEFLRTNAGKQLDRQV